MRLTVSLFFVFILFAGFRGEEKIPYLAGMHGRYITHNDTVAPAGRSIFAQYCRACHADSTKSLAPDPTILSSMTPRAIVAALDNGKMRVQGSSLTPEQRKNVAEWVTQTPIKTN